MTITKKLEIKVGKLAHMLSNNMLDMRLQLISFALGAVSSLVYYYALDSTDRRAIIDAINRNIATSYSETSLIIFLIITLAIAITLKFSIFLLRLITNQVYRALAKYNKSYFNYAMSYLYNGSEYKFRSSNFGWGERETFVKRNMGRRIIMQLLFAIEDSIAMFRKKELIRKARYSLFVKHQYINEIVSLGEAALGLNKIEVNNRDYGKACYYGALISEVISGEKLLEEIQKKLRESIELNVELAEFQLGMFMIQYADGLHGNAYNTQLEGVELLKTAIAKTTPDRVDIKNKCCITIANCLAESDDAAELAYAISMLDEIDYDDEETIKVEDNETFVKNCQAKRQESRKEFLIEAIQIYKKNRFSHKLIPKDKRLIHANYISIKQLSNTLALKLDSARKKELYIAAEEEKRKATENLMAMFAHKFRGPVDSIIFNTQHKHDERIYLDSARTMTGLLEVFSIVSTESETLIDSMTSDVGGAGSPEKAILRSLKLALMQLLTQRTIKRMSRHYWQHALRNKLIPDSTSFKDWTNQAHFSILEKEIQEKLEMEVSALSIEHGVVDMETWMRANLMATEIRVSDTRQIRFSEYGRKEALLITLMTELFVNAIKHTDATSPRPFMITWDEQENAVMFKCTNPSNRESRSGLSRGSGRGHSFLKLLLEKMHGQFQADVYQELSSVHLEIPYDLLIGETK